MAADDSDTLRRQDRPTLAQQKASEVGAMIAAQVREAIEWAERSAQELHSRALDEAEADHDEVDRAAREVLAQIDAIEDKIAQLLQELRDEVAQVTQPEQAPEPAPPAAGDAQEVDQPADPDLDAPKRRGGLFKRRSRTPPPCDVCGRAPPPDEEALERWRHEGRMSLCPDCQDDGWRLPSGGAVPYRATTPRQPG